MVDLPAELGTALDEACAAVPPRELAASVDRLIARYRNPRPAGAPILAAKLETTAYAAYRMPATWAAVRTALARGAELDPGFRPASLLDLGGGTGAAAWAAAAVHPSLAEATVFDQVPEALALGRELAARADAAVLRTVQWQCGIFAELGDVGKADLVTIAYVLSELSAADQGALVTRAAEASGDTVVVVEPGTPDGHRRVLGARDVLIEAGFSILAPCPHQERCPLAEGSDWCHAATRINRSALHRRLKRGELAHEDEKFAYVVASRRALDPAPGRVLRHPVKRKGLVTLQVCTPADGVRQTLVSKRQGPLYRAARDVEWGEAWPPAESAED